MRWIKGTAVNDGSSHETWHPPGSHRHSSGHSIATLAGTITNHNQNIRTGVANSSDTSITVSLDGMASCCNLHREKNYIESYCVVVRVWGGQYREELILNVTVFDVRVWGGQYREELILNVTVFFL